MNARKMTFTVFAIAVLAMPSLAMAQGHRGGGAGNGPGGGPDGFFGPGAGHGGFGPGMLLGRLADALDLSDDQRAEIQAIYDACRDTTAGLRDQLQAAWDDYTANHELGVFNETDARAFAATVTAIQADLMVEHMRANAEAFNVLTPEQQAELRDLMDRFGGLFGPHKGGRHCRGQS